MRRFTIQTSEAGRQALNLSSSSETQFVMFDSTVDFADHCQGKNIGAGSAWSGGMESAAAAASKVRLGDTKHVAEVDALLSRFEDSAFATMGNRVWQDDVAGAFPNVPAYLAGVPCSMRRRARQESPVSPLAVVVDLTTSGGITQAQIRQRGVAIMALVRVLTARRPVELWAGIGLGRGLTTYVLSRVETAPLDLAVATHFLTHESVSRGMGYALAHRYGCGGGWPFGTDKSIAHMGKLIAPAFDHVGETLCLPAMHLHDAGIRNPAQWLKDRLADLAPVDFSDAA